MPGSFVDALVAVMAVAGLVFCVPVFAHANGHKPFLVGYMSFFLLLGVAAVIGITHDSEGGVYQCLRLGYASVLWATTLWAIDVRKALRALGLWATGLKMLIMPWRYWRG